MSSLLESGGNAYAPGELATYEHLATLDPRGSFGYDIGKRLIRFSIEGGLIDPIKVGRVFDFGAGEGGSTLAIQDFFPKSVIEASEMDPRRALNFQRAGILPDQKFFRDGIVRLDEVKEKEAQMYDLVVAGMYGPWDTVNFEEFLRSLQGAIRDEGQTLIYSDARCIEKVYRSLESKGISFQRKYSYISSPFGMHDTIHIPAIDPQIEI